MQQKGVTAFLIDGYFRWKFDMFWSKIVISSVFKKKDADFGEVRQNVSIWNVIMKKAEEVSVWKAQMETKIRGF